MICSDSIASDSYESLGCVGSMRNGCAKGELEGFYQVRRGVLALYTAASTSERISFHTINRKTGNRVRREFVDSETGEPVERDDQVKGYELDDHRYVVLEPEEVAAAVPESDKTLRIEAFIPCDQVDTAFFDKPYYLAPDKMGEEAFVLLRDGMRNAKVAAIARTVLFRRMRTVLIRAHRKGLTASTLNYDYEVRSAQKAFDDVPEIKIEGEMLELAEHIISTKAGEFDASKFDDRYVDSRSGNGEGEDRRSQPAEEKGSRGVQTQ